MGVTDPDDPLGRKALTAKLGGGVVKKHNELVRSVSSLEREAGRISIMEVAGLYPDDRRVDTLSVAGDGHVDMTDCRVVDPHTAARMAAGESVRGAMIKAGEREEPEVQLRGRLQAPRRPPPAAGVHAWWAHWSVSGAVPAPACCRQGEALLSAAPERPIATAFCPCNVCPA